MDRLTQVTTPQADIFTTNYDLAGRTLGRVAGNATEMIRQYEAATGRLSSQQQRAGGASFNGFDYSYTERGNIAAITESGEVTRERAYSYDELERLTEVSVPTAPSQDESYELDPEGNRLSSHLSDMHSTDTANRLESDDSYTYVYDLNGNLISKLAKAGPNGTSGLSNWTYSYDTLDQLIEVEQDGLLVESYRYDAFGRRSLISTVEGAGLTVDVGLINDGSDRAIDVTQGLLGQAIPLRRYTHSANVDEPLQLETFDASGAFDAAYTYHADHLGSIRYLTDSSGTIVNAYDYDSYGRPLFGMTSFDQSFAYTGREWDAATGLYHYRARAYDAETGRFLQEDPAGVIFENLDLVLEDLSEDLLNGDIGNSQSYSRLGSFPTHNINQYRYVENNPIKYVDHFGDLPFNSIDGYKRGKVATNTIRFAMSRLQKKVVDAAIKVHIRYSRISDGKKKTFDCGANLIAGIAGLPAPTDFDTGSQLGSGCHSLGEGIRKFFGL